MHHNRKQPGVHTRSVPHLSLSPVGASPTLPAQFMILLKFWECTIYNIIEIIIFGNAQFMILLKFLGMHNLLLTNYNFWECTIHLTIFTGLHKIIWLTIQSCFQIFSDHHHILKSMSCQLWLHKTQFQYNPSNDCGGGMKIKVVK